MAKTKGSNLSVSEYMSKGTTAWDVCSGEE